MTDLQLAAERVVTADPTLVSPSYEMSFDALAEFLHEEGAHDFQDAFFEQIDEHRAG